MSLFKKIYKYVWPQVKKHQLLFWGILILFSFRTILDHLIRPILLKQIIDILSKAGDKEHDLVFHALILILLQFIIVTFFALIFNRSTKFLSSTFIAKMIKDLRDFAFYKIQSNSYSFFVNTFSGSLVTKSRRLITAFEVMHGELVYSFLPTVIVLSGVLFVLFRESMALGLVFASWVVMYIIILSLFLKKKVFLDTLEAESDSRVSAVLADIFGNILAVKFFSATKYEFNKFKEVTKDSSAKIKDSMFYGARIEAFLAVLGFLVQGTVLYLMIVLWSKNQISTGVFVLTQSYLMIVFDKLWDFGNSLKKFMKSASDMKEIFNIFETVPDILDPEKPEKLQMTEGNIVFDNVSFNYKNGKEVFENFNLNIKKGERVGLVGHSGAGKSTIVALILRFMDLNAGSIKIDGQDIRNVTQDDLRSSISYVPQESILFHRSIRENIAYGKQDATEEEIKEAAKKAHADEFIVKLQYGYDTMVGERGVKLSGGERQRVAIARAMLKDAPILILDEATSSLDSISEHYIQEAFDELMKDKTSIVIAHRLSTIQKMDRILVLDAGKIVEEGTHKELLAKNGYYAELWNHQTGGFLED